ncbi:MAG: hypothetical protein JWP15_3648 [Alphaproteobacteria bacterium]|nr:hypothetical protein [Alphaproteobacteria bacterium]
MIECATLRSGPENESTRESRIALERSGIAGPFLRRPGQIVEKTRPHPAEHGP